MQTAQRGRRNGQLGRRRGFSLLELLVVIVIFVILAALMFPVFKSMREGNQLISCTSRMQRIGQALRLYYLDERGVPPYYQDPADAAVVLGTGLQGLMAGDYVRDLNTFHCPRAVDVRLDDANYYNSYDEPDTKAGYDPSSSTLSLYGVFGQHKYLSARGVVAADPDYHRQLTRFADAPAPPHQICDMNWQPDDTAIVTWCDYHADSYTKVDGNGVEHGQYNVLFWDGSVVCFPDVAMRTTDQAAWRVRPW